MISHDLQRALSGFYRDVAEGIALIKAVQRKNGLHFAVYIHTREGGDEYQIEYTSLTGAMDYVYRLAMKGTDR
jgi:hypothetical protein